jgi:hypothetical protein
MRYAWLVAISIAVIFILPTASASIFGVGSGVYTISYDNELYEKIKPGFIGQTPEITYWRMLTTDDMPGTTIVEIFFYWRYQNTSTAQHDHDWEFLVLLVDEYSITYKTAFDSWHYVIGRDETPTLYNDTHVVVKFAEGTRGISMYKETVFGDTISESWNYSVPKTYIDITVLRRAAEQVGFDEDLYNDPAQIFEKGMFGYKRFSAFRSVYRSFLVYIDYHLDWVDFGGG